MTTDPTSHSEEKKDTIDPMTEEITEQNSEPSSWGCDEALLHLQEQLARSQADYINLVRRSREESAQIGQWTEDKTILKFLPILDNLERSLEHIPAELTNNAWVEWNKSIVRAMQKIISDFGIIPMNPLWEDVNPDLHDVISQIPHKLTTIQAVVEKWYVRWEKALRHAKVIVWDGQMAA